MILQPSLKFASFCYTVLLLFSSFLSQAQNTGIGTVTPQQKLDVAGSVTIRDSLAIGNFVPAYKLDVNGSSRFNGDMIVNNADINGTWFYLTNSSGQPTGWKLVTGGIANQGGIGKLFFYNNNNSSALTLTQYGYVGIGTNNPSSQLTVNGGARISGASIQLSNTADNSSGNVSIGDFVYSNTKLNVTSNQLYGLYVVDTAAGSNAAVFEGNVTVLGTLSKAAGSFKIDHPLDPANKYLYHSFVESPDMMNIYNGNITTGTNGEAVVTLPDFFEALNKDFRYQLTVIGDFAQATVFKKVNNNRFSIKTDKPNIEVSWQVTGIRKDAFAEKNRIPVVVDKPANERGRYLYPEALGLPASKSVMRVLLKKEDKE